MHRVWSDHDVAQGLGQELGVGVVLLRCLPGQEGEEEDFMKKVRASRSATGHPGAGFARPLSARPARRVPSLGKMRHLLIVPGDQLVAIAPP